MDDSIKRSDVWNITAILHSEFITIEQEQILERIDEMVDGLPSADRPQGEWVYCEDEYGIDGYRCSNCGKHIAWDYQHKFINFIEDYHTCPFCDARMKGADDAQ